MQPYMIEMYFHIRTMKRIRRNFCIYFPTIRQTFSVVTKQRFIHYAYIIPRHVDCLHVSIRYHGMLQYDATRNWQLKFFR